MQIKVLLKRKEISVVLNWIIIYGAVDCIRDPNMYTRLIEEEEGANKRRASEKRSIIIIVIDGSGGVGNHDAHHCARDVHRDTAIATRYEIGLSVSTIWFHKNFKRKCRVVCLCAAGWKNCDRHKSVPFNGILWIRCKMCVCVFARAYCHMLFISFF